MDTNVPMKLQQSTWRKFGILNWDIKNQEKKVERCIMSIHFWTFFWLYIFVFFFVSPTLPGAIWAKWVFIDSCVICFQKIFSPIWTIWVWTKSCWGPCGKSFGPTWIFRTFLPSQQKLSSKANKTNLLFSRFFRPFVPTPIFGLSGPWGSVQNLVGTPLGNHLDQHENLGHLYQLNKNPFPSPSGPIWILYNVVRFVQKKSVLAYLDLWALYSPQD